MTSIPFEIKGGEKDGLSGFYDIKGDFDLKGKKANELELRLEISGVVMTYPILHISKEKIILDGENVKIS